MFSSLSKTWFGPTAGTADTCGKSITDTHRNGDGEPGSSSDGSLGTPACSGALSGSRFDGWLVVAAAAGGPAVRDGLGEARFAVNCITEEAAMEMPGIIGCIKPMGTTEPSTIEPRLPSALVGTSNVSSLVAPCGCAAGVSSGQTDPSGIPAIEQADDAASA